VGHATGFSSFRADCASTVAEPLSAVRPALPPCRGLSGTCALVPRFIRHVRTTVARSLADGRCRMEEPPEERAVGELSPNTGALRAP
jgi:hypothetical protein